MSLFSPDAIFAMPVTQKFRAWALGVVERGDAMVALAVIWLVLLTVQVGTPNIVGNDGYYHIKVASLMRQQGLRIEFPWLPLTILNPRDFTDHHLLFHVLLLPFTFGDLRLGAKAAALVFATLALFSIYLLMARLRVRYPLLWLLALLGSAPWFLARESMTRRQSLSLGLLVLATYLLIRGRFRWLLPVAILYGWLVDGPVLLVALVAIGFLARLLAERRSVWPIPGWTALGLGLALVANPYFPNNVRFAFLHVMPKVMPPSDVGIGAEWLPYPPSALLEGSWLALLLVPLGLVPAILAPRRVGRDHAALLLGGLALLFLVLYLRYRRFIELEPAFALLFCAYTWTHYFPMVRGRALGEWLPPASRAAALIALSIGLGSQVWVTVLSAQEKAASGAHYATFQSASQWLEENTEIGELVYQTDWDDFPRLFFYNTHNIYVVGLDPTYLSLADLELYRIWRDIGRGLLDAPSSLIRERFGTRWVITDLAHTEFIARARSDPGLEAVFQSPNAIIYRVKP